VAVLSVFSQGKARDIFLLVGPIALLLGCFFGVFSRGIVNASFALLFLWALVTFFIFYNEGSVPKLPRIYLLGLAFFLFSYLLSSVFSGNHARSFSFLLNITYLLLTAISVWVAFSFGKEFIQRIVPYCYGAGLVFWFLIAISEAKYCFACLRSKADLGIIESGAVLAQVIPLMLGALAITLHFGHKKRAGLFVIFMIFGALSLYLNCSRIALIVVPISSGIMLYAFRKFFGKLALLIIILAVIVGGAFMLKNDTISSRFMGIFESESTNTSNQFRYVRWRKGLSEFLKHPVLGTGPNAIPNARYEDLPAYESNPESEHSEYYHSHMVYLTVMAESGILGLLGFLALHIFPLLYIWPFRNSEDHYTRFYVWGSFCVFVQLFLNGVVDHVFSLKPLMYIYWTVTSIAMFKVKRERDFFVSLPLHKD
jgi:O-antigen ligase